MDETLRVLIIEDSEDDAFLIIRNLKRAGFTVDSERVQSGSEMRRSLSDRKWDIILSDYILPNFSGLEALNIYKEFGLDIPFISVSGNVGEDVIVEVMKAGAHDYIMKDKLTRLAPAVERELKEYETRQLQRLAESRLKQSEERYRTIFESSGTAIALVDEDTTVLMINHVFADLIGYHRREIEGKMKWSEFVDANQLGKLLEYNRLRRVDEDSVPSSYELDYFPKNGERRHASINVALLAETKQSLVSFIDITERKKTDAERLALNKASRAVLTGKDFLTTSRQIFNYCREVTGAKAGYIALLNKEKDLNDVLFLEAGGMPCTVDPELDMPVRGLRAEAYRTRKTVYHNNFISSEWQELMPAGHVVLNNVLFSPLIINEEAVGVIGIANKESDFNEWDVRIVSSLAEICSIALINSRNLELLTKSEETFRLAMDVTYDGLWDWDIEHSLVYYSPRWANIIGEESVPPLLNAWSDRLHPDDKDEALRRVEQHLKAESDQFYFEHRLRLTGGNYKWVLGRGRVVDRDSDGRALRMIGTMTDISARKFAEEELLREKMRIENIVNTARTIILMLDMECRIIDFNPYTEELIGYSRDEMIGKNWIEIMVPEEWRGEIVQRFGKSIIGEYSRGEANPIITRNGERREIEWHDTVIRDEAGNAISVLATGQDVTDRIQMMNALQESEEKFSKVFYSNPNPMLIVAPKSGVISDANESLLHFIGCDFDDCIGNTMTGLGLWLVEEERIGFIDLLTAEDRVQDFETEMRIKNGDIRSVLLSVETVSIMEEPFRIVSINDITERKKIQEQLIVTDRLASVGELAAGIAHELNNPLTGVIGFSDLLMSRDDIPEKARDDLAIVNKEAIRASQVARHLLTFARKHPDQKTPVDVIQIIKLVLELRAYEQKVNNITVNADFDPDIPMVLANDFQLQQVFLNIIINAEHFMIEEHRGGELSIRVRNNHGKVCIRFRDDGPGIPPELLPRIFDPFFTTKEVGKGTGLGLSICYGIITEHGGSIKAEADPEGGAVFYIELPELDPEHNF